MINFILIADSGSAMIDDSTTMLAMMDEKIGVPEPSRVEISTTIAPISVLATDAPLDFPTSTKKSRRTRTTRKTPSSERQRQRSTRRPPFLTGPFSLYQRTSSLAPVVYPTRQSDPVAVPTAEPHPLNINLNVYLYNKDENGDKTEDYDDSAKQKQKPVLIAKEKVPVLPSGFEPVEIDLQGILSGVPDRR